MIATTKYYDEFLRYVEMASIQQEECNLGPIPHTQGSVKDDLMRQVTLYDVVERKYAGFNQLMLDVWYGTSRKHPYYLRGSYGSERLGITRNFKGWRQKMELHDMLFVFLVHRLTGSAIHYGKQPSGYHNTIIPDFYQCSDIQEMQEMIKYRDQKISIYTSIGYQFPAFPKPPGHLCYTKGGDYFMCEMLQDLCYKLANFLETGLSKTLRQVGEFMFQWNVSKGLRKYKFQYAAVIADIADFYPRLVDRTSSFYYGSNAVECLRYMIDPSEKRNESGLDRLVEKAMLDTGYVPYNIEDQMCDCIRWIENYIRPGNAYDHLDRNAVWSNHTIIDHPFGRQKPMADWGFDFNSLPRHPSDDHVIQHFGMSVDEYKRRVHQEKHIKWATK